MTDSSTARNAPGHAHAKPGCTRQLEVYDGKHHPGSNGWWLKRCRDCNVEWWSQEEDPRVH